MDAKKEAYIRERKERAKQLRLERAAQREAAKAAKKAAKAAKAKEAREKQALAQRERYFQTTKGVDVSWDVPFASVKNNSKLGGETALYLDIWRAPASDEIDTASCPPTPPSVNPNEHLNTQSGVRTDSAKTLLPVIMWLHGGGWRYGSHHFLPKFFRPLLFGNSGSSSRSNRRFAVVSVGYRKSTQAPFPASDIHSQ